MAVDRPWYHLKLSTTGAISLKGAEFFSGVIKNNKPSVIEIREMDFFSAEWLKDLSFAVQNDVSSAMIFYRPANFQIPVAHIDINTNMIKKTGKIISPNAAVNFLYDGNQDDSEMIWYDRPIIKDTDVKWTDAGTAYLDFDPITLTEIARCCINNNLTLVRTDIPHNVIMRTVPRLCVSFRFQGAIWKESSWNGIVDQCHSSFMHG